ncbi:DEAD/DEAH box helicase [Rossellomorea sp. YZS02]|uniref:DEAD/DEAH box helicase n=1 Tax=Rossellomorea sp. YZS02 TaxID=3097358 RepID=UPI002A147986|nr:DEAD/DEAH box helicase family protein [Rossellomorea sp. YZS02]MDX8345806.1 DEAD/DEAH box helicase family protein [Rossellomorea sp. YZS02]
MYCYFQENYENLQFRKAKKENRGLRKAQLGATHAIASYFTKENSKQALVVLPTGTGKTAVIMISPYLLDAKKVLIITPSILVRNQIAEDFRNLKTLKDINVLPEICMNPIVFELTDSKIENHIDTINNSDVIVATPHGAYNLSINTKVKDKFDLILVDEAHHEPAKKWREALENFANTKRILFTATPFRLDNKKIQADLIYSYSLSQAYEDKIFGEISFIPVEISANENRDVKISVEAEKIFYEDKLKGYKHSLMVRAGSIEESKILLEIYKKNTELKLEVVHSRLSAKTVRTIIGKLKNGNLNGVVCVDMMSEGFDFPNLKIGAIHSPHKSLAVTLQFIGRFARTNANNIGSAKFIAVNDDDFILENYKLFSQDAVWKDIIINLSESQIIREEENQKFINRFTIESDTSKDIVKEIAHLRPNFHAKVFQTDSFNIDAIFPEMGFKLEGVLVNKENSTVITILKDLVVPRWATTQSELYDKSYYLVVLYYSQETNLLFINSQLKSENLYYMVGNAYCGEDFFHKISRNQLHRVLGGMTNFEIFNSGLQNRVSNEESYTISSGPNVSNTYDPATGRLYAAGHVFCKARINGIETTLGYSSGSKIWSSSYGSIKEFIDWCSLNASKIIDKELVVKTNTAYDFVPLPEVITKFPETIFCVKWSNNTYSNPRNLILGENISEKTVLDIDLVISTINENEIQFYCNFEGERYLYSLSVNGKVKLVKEDKELFLQVGKHQQRLSDYLQGNPLEMLTTDLSLVTDGEIAKNNFRVEQFVPDLIKEIKWKEYKTDIAVEFGITKNSGLISIHEALERILSEINYDYLIYDHGTGEVADYVGIRITENEIHVHFFHVKAMKGKTYNNSVNDLYDVVGQSIKSIIWLKTKSVFRTKIISRKKSGYSKFIVGNYRELINVLQTNKILKAKIIAVQPSVKHNHKMTEKISELLAATNHYIKHSGSANEFMIWGS